MDDKNSKPFWKSKTIWVNVLLGVAQYAEYLPAKYAVYVVVGVNLALRFITEVPITVK